MMNDRIIKRAMPNDPGIHIRRSIRLKGYDYSQAGGFFGIFEQGDIHFLGDVNAGGMVLSNAGKGTYDFLIGESMKNTGYDIWKKIP